MTDDLGMQTGDSMITYKKQYKMEPVWRNQDWVMEKAQAALKAPVLHITDLVSAQGAPLHRPSH